MSTTLATVADALIEFILSLLSDPEASEEFDEDPQAALANRGLNNVRAEDVCAVAPVIVERSNVVHHQAPAQQHHHSADPVVREIQTIKASFSWVDDRDTLIDQSTNQNIWAGGDVLQIFDQSAVVASGDGSMAAGEDIEQSLDASTNIGNGAGGDVNVGNETTTVDIDESFNETDASTTNDVDVEIDDSFNDDSSEQTTVEDSGNTTTETTTETNTDVNVEDVVVAGNDAVVVEVEPAPAPAPAPAMAEPEPEPEPAFAEEEAVFEEPPADDEF